MNEGDIELNTGSAINAKVIITANRMETSGDVFINGNSESLSSLLANLTMRLQTAQDEITTIKSEIQNLLSAETDPQVGTVTQNKWCVGASGGQVECTADAPLLSYTETDPKIGTVTDGKWCTANSGKIECVQEVPAGVPSECRVPYGRLGYAGVYFVCVCDSGYSGAHCEVEPSLSRAEALTDSVITAAQPISDGGNEGSLNDYTRAMDADITTLWKADSNANAYIIFDMQTAVHISGLAMKTPLFDVRGPKDCKLEYGGSINGPWSTALNFELSKLAVDWQYFVVPITITTRYSRILVVNNHGSINNIQFNEVEFFQTNPGTRVEPTISAPQDCIHPRKLESIGGKLVCSTPISHASDVGIE